MQQYTKKKLSISITDFPNPGDLDLYKGIKELNKSNYRNALKYFQKSAIYDNEYATLFAAIIYFTGFGLTKRNPTKAMDLFKKVASNWSNRVAQYFVGTMYFEGDEGVPQDTESGFHWLSLAARNGWLYAMGYIGYAYTFGESVTEDHSKALSWFKRVVRNDDNDTSLIDDGTLYLFGCKKFRLNLSRVNQEVIKAAQTNTRSKLASPVQYVKNISNSTVPHLTEVQRVTFWDVLTNKKSSGVAACQFYISTIYADIKNHSPRDIGKAFRWAAKAAKNRCPLSCRFIGLHYEYGTVVKLDYKQAMKWYELSCDFGDRIESLFRIGSLYFDGKGVKRDHKLALAYFKDTINVSNHGEAYFLMGDIYRLGQDGVVRNYRRAYQCYLKAFGYGIVSGGTEIGLLFCKGLGVNLDKEKACKWFSKAASMDCLFSLNILEAIDLEGFDVVSSTMMKSDKGVHFSS